MIRLTLHPHSNPEIHLFNKSSLCIGSASSGNDLSLPNSSLKAEHLKIVEEKGACFLINIANDPFSSVNGRPFGKKLLRTGDIISTGQEEILFEQLPKAGSPIKESSPESVILSTPLVSCQADDQTTQPFMDFVLPFEKDVSAFADHEMSTLSNTLLKEESAPKTNKGPAAIDRAKMPHLKDDYLREFDDENQNRRIDPQATSTGTTDLGQAWRWVMVFAISVIAIAGTIGLFVYLNISDKTELQETQAAEGVSDIAMALTRAQILHLKPHNQNWSDIEFLRTNLKAFALQNNSSAADIDSQGQFRSVPYSLRIYTSSDLSRFLLIAQPAPSLLHWLIPKSAIVVDSRAMELKTLKDLRTLNRLLANSDPLEGNNGQEIAALVKQGHSIPLTSLHGDYQAPEALSMAEPGATNLIYNAPRYYRLSQPMIQKAIALTSGGTSQQVSALKQEADSFARLQNLVLYVPEGKTAALLARQGLKTFAPAGKMWIGLIDISPEGRIQSTQILEESPLLVASDLPELAANDLPPTAQTQDSNHPLFIQLSALAQARTAELRPISNAMKTLLVKDLERPQPALPAEMDTLLKRYKDITLAQDQHILESMEALFTKYDDVPLATFILFIKKLGFDHLIPQDEDSFCLGDENCQQNFDTLFTYIDTAKTPTDLEYTVSIASSWLTFDYIHDANKLLRYQTILRNALLARLEKWLLSAQQHLAFKELSPQDDEALHRLLADEKLVRSEERLFFLEEFSRNR